ncbi:MAG: CAP domain-containing protein [Parvularcula sp.]
MALAIVGASGLGACASSADRYWPTAADATQLSMPLVVKQVNQVRRHYSLRPLMVNSKLTAAATRQARYQAAVHRMSHYGYRGARLEERLSLAHYDYRIAGENVSRGRQTERDVVMAWMNSRTHRDMMLNPDIKEIGVAAAIDDQGQVFWSMVMAEPARPQARVPNPVAATTSKSFRVVFW